MELSPALLESIARQFGTPCYVYDDGKLEAQCRAMRSALPEARLCFAVKACSSGAILQRIFSHGFGADVVSGGELVRAVRAGVQRGQVVFSGVGKRNEEIEQGLQECVTFNVESLDELGRIHQLALAHRQKAEVFFRVNPNIAVDTNPYIATGLYSTKFGIAEAQLETAVRLARSLPSIALTGLSCHLGSQIASTEVFEKGALRLAELAHPLKQGHPEFQHLDLGGGLGVAYEPNQASPPSIESYAAAVRAGAAAGLKLTLEPGRWLVAEAGSLLTRVITLKSTPQKHFAVVDAGMNDLIRPALYKAFHPVRSVNPSGLSLQTYDIVGPVCETGDFLALARVLPALRVGDLLQVGICGAYAATMASNYNSRPRAPEVLIENGSARLIRRRETLESLFADEIL